MIPVVSVTGTADKEKKKTTPVEINKRKKFFFDDSKLTVFTFEGRAGGQFVVVIAGRISQRRFGGVRLFVLVNGGFFVLFVVWRLVNGLLPHLKFLLQIYKKKR